MEPGELLAYAVGNGEEDWRMNGITIQEETFYTEDCDRKKLEAREAVISQAFSFWKKTRF
jgi:hypothetical protein